MKVYDAEGTAFVLDDPDLSTLRDTLPGNAYEPLVLALLAPLLREPGAIFADVGALYGYLSVWAARHAPTATVIAFEPEPSYTAVIRRNLAANGLGGVRVEEVALVDEEGIFDFSTKTIVPFSPADKRRGYLHALRAAILDATPPAGPVVPVVASPSQSRVGLASFLATTLSYSLRTRLSPRAVDRTHEVRGITFDAWCRETSIFPTVVKIDVHGGEGMVLGGMKKTLRGSVRHVFLELHTRDLLVKYDHRAILDMLLQANFEIFALQGFRSSKGWLEPLSGPALDRASDQRTWSPLDLYFMRFLYARRTDS
ncbi:FkbM family methyltransferase [Frankia sp. Cj3]|uniref:FkbM family methyltransferase n=1 Tax=Frankia sp. Cj3 TaxID=2880976 RepID=UPI001EF69E1B|nr:FkbM family methyltransferase [Frankia sp. Cj3]